MFAQTHTPGMGTDRDTKLGGHQQYRENLTHTSETDGVNLADIDCFSLEKLLENNSIVSMFTSRDTDPIRLESLSDGSMPEDIVWSSRLLDEPRRRRSGRPSHNWGSSHTPRLNFGQAFGILDRLVHVPHLVRVNHQHCTCRSSVLSLQSWAIRVVGEVLRIINDGANEFASSEVRLKVAPDFHLEVLETFRGRFFRQLKDFVV